MKRRIFVAASIGTTCGLPSVAQYYSDYTKDPRPDVPEGTWTVGGFSGEVFKGSPVISGPSPDAISILYPGHRNSRRVDLEDDQTGWNHSNGWASSFFRSGFAALVRN